MIGSSAGWAPTGFMPEASAKREPPEPDRIPAPPGGGGGGALEVCDSISVGGGCRHGLKVAVPRGCLG